MKKLMLSALGAATLALSACGEGNTPSVPPDFVPQEPVTQPTPDTAVLQRFELRLRGVNAQAYDAVLVPIRSMQVSVGGAPLRVQHVARTVDLTAEDHAHLVGYFFVPQGVEKVQVALTFDDFGGWEQGGRGGALETRGAPLRFEAPVDYLSQRGRAVVVLDVGRSLVAHKADSLLLPSLSVNY